MSEPYRPSNGTEGDSFMAAFCQRCVKFSHCRILGDTMAFDIKHPDYPKQWIRDEQGPRCTAFIQRGLRQLRASKRKRRSLELFP